MDNNFLIIFISITFIFLGRRIKNNKKQPKPENQQDMDTSKLATESTEQEVCICEGDTTRCAIHHTSMPFATNWLHFDLFFDII